MKLHQKVYFQFLLGILLLTTAVQAQEVTTIKEAPVSMELFDDNWRFFRGGALRAETPNFDDSQWRVVDLPHDWSIEDIPGTASPFNPDAAGQVGTGFTVGGTGWYRKSFNVPQNLNGKRLMILFEGIYMNADVWINGKHLGNHPYGYTSFWYDLTDWVKYGQENILSVQVKNEGQNSRWYSGSGIYRHVWLRVTNPVHIEQWGTSVTTPEITAVFAKIKINTRLVNKSVKESSVRLVTRILDKSGNEKARSENLQAIPAGELQEIINEIRIEKPERWSVDSPVLYTAVSEVYSDDQVIDKQETKFGIRIISFDIEKGFQLNGVSVELKGGCVHHDNGPLGSRAYDRAEERRVELLKASGYNAIRCAHNPPSPAFLDACDKLGMLVIDEAFDMWIYANNAFDYHLYFRDWWKRDIESMIWRDINHPSIILWSIGNEIGGMESPEVVAVANDLQLMCVNWTKPGL
jgi:beta-galactosidase